MSTDLLSIRKSIGPNMGTTKGDGSTGGKVGGDRLLGGGVNRW